MPRSRVRRVATSGTAPLITTPAQPFSTADRAITSPMRAEAREPPPSTTSTRPSPGPLRTRFTRALSRKQRMVAIGPANAVRPPYLMNCVSQLASSASNSSIRSAVANFMPGSLATADQRPSAGGAVARARSPATADRVPRLGRRSRGSAAGGRGQRPGDEAQRDGDQRPVRRLLDLAELVAELGDPAEGPAVAALPLQGQARHLGTAWVEPADPGRGAGHGGGGLEEPGEEVGVEVRGVGPEQGEPWPEQQPALPDDPGGELPAADRDHDVPRPQADPALRAGLPPRPRTGEQILIGDDRLAGAVDLEPPGLDHLQGADPLQLGHGHQGHGAAAAGDRLGDQLDGPLE